MKRQAYLITAYKDIKALEDLISKVSPLDKIYVHIDRRSKEIKMADPILVRLSESGNCHFFSKYRITWGSYTHVEAMLFLMEKALSDAKDNGDEIYIHMVTGEDVFLASPETIHERFTDTDDRDKIYLDYFEEKDFSPEVIKRYDTYFMFKDRNLRNPFVWHLKNFIRLCQKAAGVKRTSLGGFDKVYKGLFYISMPGECAADILNYLNAHPDYESDMKKTELPEEFFFHTLLLNDGFENGKWKDRIVKKELRFMKWEGASPKYLSAGDMEDIKKAADEGYIFARKVNDDHLRKEIEKVIL